MASAAPNNNLPMFYSNLEPLNVAQHGKMKIRPVGSVPMMARAHTIPVTVDEFALAQRHYPIVFAIGDNPLPLALMGLNEGVNTFLDSDGRPLQADTYLPAYMRRYPFLLARLRPDSDELSLCFDPTSGAVGDFETGEPLFDGNEPSQATKAILEFCELFETAGQRTAAFVEDLQKAGLLMDGEVAIQPEGAQAPFIYRGFQMVDEEKLRNLSDEDAARFHKNGMLPLIYAHMFSLTQMRDLFERQRRQGKGPAAVPQPQTANA